MPVSLDTYKSGVAKAGLSAGADLINDIWGLKYDPEMAPVIGQAGVPCVLMHNRERAEYQDFLKDVLGDLEESVRIAGRAGIARDKIILVGAFCHQLQESTLPAGTPHQEKKVIFVMVGIRHRALHRLSKHSTTELHPFYS